MVEIKAGQGTSTKKQIKRNINKIARGVLLYELILILIVIIDMIIKTVMIYEKSNNQAWIDKQVDKLANASMLSGTSSVIAIIIGIIFLMWYFRKYDFGQAMFKSDRSMTVKAFLRILIIFMSIQLVFSLLSVGVENIFNHFGYSISEEIESASANSQTLSMLIYASFLGPITEEIVFRGYVMRGLKRYGKIFAIVISAIIFGAYHGNFVHSIFAAFVGLVLGYVAMEYSIKWSIVLHIFNNFVFGDLLSHITSGLGERVQLGLIYTMESAFFLGAVIILLKKRKDIKKYIVKEKTNPKLYILAATSIWMIIYISAQVLQALSGITSI